MHELGIVFHIIRTLEEVASENQVSRISGVTLELGEVSGVVGDYLTDCWKWAVNRTELLRDSVLTLEPIPGITLCNACSSTYETVAHGKTCPHCGSLNTVLLQGNQVNIKQIEAT